jgi:dihydroxyacetone kinase phosphoprotein-dependent L subunit
VNDDLLVRWLTLAGARVAAARERLTDLDAAIGDGDHGINLDRGFRELVRLLEAGLPGGIVAGSEVSAVVLEAAGRALIGTVGGASGALYGRGFQRAGAALLGPRGAASPLDGRSAEERAVIAFGAAVDAIVALGRATTGEKTMLDALVPAHAAFAAAVARGATLGLAARHAAEAAEVGAEATFPLIATKGRASYLGERSIGHLDPGAVSSAILLRALADAAAAEG